MSAGNINILLDIWAATLYGTGRSPPFANADDLYHVIDSAALGDVPWESFKTKYEGDQPEHDVPAWMTAEYEVWFRDPRKIVHNLLGNPDFDGEIDYAPLREFCGSERRLENFMSGDWVWRQAVK